MMPVEQKRKGVFASENPFRSELIQRIPIRLGPGGWPESLDRLRRLNFRAAIVGQKGSGKTCLLEQLSGQLSQNFDLPCQLVGLSADKAEHSQQLDLAVGASSNGAVILLDGIERLSFLHRNRVFRKTLAGPGLVVSVHRKCRLPTWIRFRTSLSLMKRLLDDLDVATPEVLAAGDQAFRDSRGNIREAFRLLYDQFADGRLVRDA